MPGIGFSSGSSASEQATKWAQAVYMGEFGAVPDGQNYRLTDRFPNLAAAKLVYPDTVNDSTSLEENMNTHAIQAAVNAAIKNNGGDVVWPRGNLYVVNQPFTPMLPLFSDRQGVPSFLNSKAQVNLVGYGDQVSRVTFDGDVGPAQDYTTMPTRRFGMQCGEILGDPVNQQANSRHADNAQSAGYLRDFAFYGPGRNINTGTNLGSAAGIKMGGFALAARREVQRVRMNGFWEGFNIVGDHTTFSTIKSFNNFFDIYFDASSITMYGDLVFTDKIMLENARMATIGFHPCGWMNDAHWMAVPFAGRAPYSILKEATPLNPDGSVNMPSGYAALEKRAFLAGNKFDTFFSEGVGNGVVFDDNVRVNGTARSTLARNQWLMNKFPGWQDDRKIAGRDRSHFVVGTTVGEKFLDFTKLDGNGCTRPLIDILTDVIGTIEFAGDIEAWFNSAKAVGQMPIRVPSDIMAPRVKFRHTAGDGNCGPWEGSLRAVYNGFTVLQRGAVGTQFDGVKMMQYGDQDSQFVGLARTDAFPNNPAISGTQSFVAVAEEGYRIPFIVASPVSLQSALKISTSAGGLTAGNGWGDDRNVAFASNATGLCSILRGAAFSPDINRRRRKMKSQGGAAYTFTRGDWGYIIRLSHTGSRVKTATVASGGTGYAVGDTITLAGGTFTSAAVLTVASIGANGAVSNVNVTNAGNYTVTPASPVSQASSSGAGTGATFTVTYERIPIIVTLPNNMPEGYENEDMMDSDNRIKFEAASGATVKGILETTDVTDRNKTWQATVISNTTGTNAEWLIR